MLKPAAFLIPVLAFFAIFYAIPASAAIPHIGQEEIEMGNEAATEAEKEQKLLDNPELLARVTKIGESIATAANGTEIAATYGNSSITPFTYTFKIIDDNDVNAFSLPGGHIYLYKGLIDICETDHELAAVIAHEIAHAAHHHMVYLLREQSRLEGKMAIILVAGMLGNMNSADMGNVMMGAQFYKTAKVSGYGQKAEQDADAAAVGYMRKAGYNPVAMLTFLEKLADKPELIEWGILQTHPRSVDRVEAIKSLLISDGIEINRRAVTTSSLAVVVENKSGSLSGYNVEVGSIIICKLLQHESAEIAAGNINKLLDAGLQFKDLRLDGSRLSANGVTILLVSEGDATLAGKSSAGVASDAYEALRRVLFKQMVADLW